MKALIDTNVIMDVLMNREPYAEHSIAFLKLCGVNVTGCIAASQTTDIFYLLTRQGKDVDTARNIVKDLTNNLTLLDVLAKDVTAAFSIPMKDFEDALIAQCARRARVDYIITRNEKDFINSPVPAYTPIEYLERFSL